MRIIAKLDVKPPYVVKPVHFEGLRKIGSPKELAEEYYLQGADEIMYIDIVASLYRREILTSHIADSAKNILVPFGVGGGVRSVEDFSALFHLGADKVIINSFAVQKSPSIINDAVKIFGSQSVVVNIEAKRAKNSWECYTDCGRLQSGRSVVDWVEEVQDRGAGEIFLQSVDMDGRQRGFDIDLVQRVIDVSKVPVIAASGAGSKEDILKVAKQANPSAVCISSLLHYKKCTIGSLKNFLIENEIEVSS